MEFFVFSLVQNQKGASHEIPWPSIGDGVLAADFDDARTVRKK